MHQGTITAISQYGFKVSGAKDAKWHNWANELDDEDRQGWEKGHNIEWDANGKGYVIAIRSLDGPMGAGQKQEGALTPHPEPRAERELYIARESAVKSAIKLLMFHQPWLAADGPAKIMGVLATAAYIEKYIVTGEGPTRVAPPPPSPSTVDPDDIPFQ